MQYKAETPDISTQAGSLETFELLARMGAWNGWWTGGGSQVDGEGGRERSGEGREGLTGWVVGWKQTKSTTSNENSAILIHSSSFQTSYKGTAPHNYYPPLFLLPPLPTRRPHLSLVVSRVFANRNRNQYFIAARLATNFVSFDLDHRNLGNPPRARSGRRRRRRRSLASLVGES